MTIIIGILGCAGAGKSTAAAYLNEKYGAKCYSLAGPLKAFTQSALMFTDEQMFGTQEQKEMPDERYGGKSARFFLQRLGTQGGRMTFGEDFWTRMCLESIAKESPEVACIDDVRFVSEAKAIRNMTYGTFKSPVRGVVWRLENPNRETTADASHVSETEWQKAPYDFIISPIVRGIPQLKQLIDDAARHIGLFPKRPELPL